MSFDLIMNRARTQLALANIHVMTPPLYESPREVVYSLDATSVEENSALEKAIKQHGGLHLIIEETEPGTNVRELFEGSLRRLVLQEHAMTILWQLIKPQRLDAYLVLYKGIYRLWVVMYNDASCTAYIDLGPALNWAK